MLALVRRNFPSPLREDYDATQICECSITGRGLCSGLYSDTSPSAVSPSLAYITALRNITISPSILYRFRFTVGLIP
jgi:hypothetical protein